MPPAGEPVQTRQRNRGRSLHVNGLPVYRMADREMVDRAGDRLIYSVDYFTTAVTLSYLAALREEFEIPNDVELIVPGPNDLPSQPPPSCITLSTEFFRAGLRLPFHAFLRRTLTRLNVSPMQLNANTYRILISCYILWAKNFVTKLPFRAFQNLYRMKLAPASSGSYYFQGGRWLYGHLPYGEVREGEWVPITFRRGYVWTRGSYVEAGSLDKIDILREKADPERNQHRLLSPMSLEKYHWFGSSSTSGKPDDLPRTAQPGEVTVASRMPNPVMHYHARTVVMVEVATTSGRSKVPWGVPVAPSHGHQSGSSSPRTWGPRVADEDMDLVFRQLFPARGLWIEGCFAIHVFLWSDHNRVLTIFCLHLQNQQWPSRNSEGVSALATRIGWPGYKRSPKPVMVARAEQGLRQAAQEKISRSLSCLPPGVDGKTPGLVILAESSHRSDPLKANSDLVNKLVEAVCLAFSGNVAVRDLFNRIEEKVTSLDSKAKSVRSAEKSVEERAKATEEKVKDAEKRASQAESARRKAEEARQDAEKRASQTEDDLATARSEQS
ncbi:hypothetical protein TIFTF001_044432 [Ficus carica]|uniref:Uncharacterized protein n=1 Tax=Ficus carica TaxID=3494 RepID=A0AA88CQ11_FICCA|nr:hypothetical protein TIFTF001_044418 [Ficus carica]GMN30186.1 hypothetical protein TIFTF001_044422 [Ficus carica]GMN30202.1 hypothetical protein TIFTF001_044428 [Ficus carica]GMN30233.1 hypothetical protein TIFTF001_044432 [Ficus carica]